MTIMYDFDGTLTPFKNPQYPILAAAGSVDEFYEILNQQKNFMEEYCPTFKSYLNDRGYDYNEENICYNADTIELNPGVLDFLHYFYNNGHKQFIISASYEKYIKKTLVAPFCTGIFGTKISTNLDDVMMPNKKIATIIHIIEQYNLNPKEIIYIGDGFTDKNAFEFVKNNGGTSIFVYDELNQQDKQIYQTFLASGLVNQGFPKNFNLNAKLFQYIQDLIRGYNE